MSTGPEDPTSIFPLPLVAIEHWFIAKDKPEYPMHSWVILNFSGKFDQSTFKKAVLEAIKKHPLFSALHKGDVRDRTSKNFWVDGQGISPWIDWDDNETPLKFPQGPSIDLHKELGIRFFIRENSETTKLMIQVHHACADGIGIILFLKDLLEIYTAAYSNNIQQDGSNKRELLLNRDRFLIKKRAFNTGAFFEKCRQTINLFILPVKPLAIPHRDKGEQIANSYPAYLSYTFTQEQTEKLHGIAIKKGVVLNSLLLADLFLTVDRWNRKFGEKGKSGSVRIAVPAMLRHLLNPDTPATNAMSLCFIDQKESLSQDPDQLLKNVNRTLLRALKRNWGLVFLKALQFLGKFKGAIGNIVKKDRCYITMISAYMGEVDAFLVSSNLKDRLASAHLKLDQMEGTLALERMVYAGLTSIIYDKELTITLTYHADKFTPETAQELLSSYITKISQGL